MPTPLVYLNGEYLPLERACVPVLDRGFLFGDGVYEVIPAYAGRPFRLAQHLERLTRSLREIRMEAPLSPNEWERIMARLLEQRGILDQAVYLQVTRGVDTRRDHLPSPGIRPTVFVMCTPIEPPSPEIVRRGIAAVTAEDSRWMRCDIKAITLLANVLLRQQARDQEAIEAILIRDGKATEGAASNLFVVRGGELITPPKGPKLLPGITRDLLLELAADNGLAHREREVEEAELPACEELWLTSSTREILPVTRLNGQPVGEGLPGPLWRRMNDLYQGYKRSLAATDR